MYVAEGRTVLTWEPDGMPRGVITGKHHADLRIFAVEHIILFPGQPPLAGLAMCRDLLRDSVPRFDLAAIVLMIHPEYAADGLRKLARAFGFTYWRQQDERELWRREVAA